MWKPEHRAAADRRGLRYESDLTDAEWALVAPLIRPAKRGGRPRTVNVREVLNAIFYVLWTGCQWKALPKDLPPRSTVWEYLDLWDWDGTLERIHHALYVEMRENAGREASPTTAIIDRTYGPPRPQVACFPRLNSLQKRIRPSRRGVWPRWRSARSGPHKGDGVERHLTPEGSRTPFDCQAIFLSPLADNVPDEGLVEYLLQAAIASAS